MKLLKYDIRLNTILKKGIIENRDDFDISIISGYQGTGKNWLACLLALDNNRNIITNIHSLRIPKRNICYFTKIEEIYQWNDLNCLYIIDECSKKWPKDCKQDLKFYSWLQQSRKHQRYVLLIFQEYIQIPTWMRGVANKVYTTKKNFLGLCVSSLGVPVLDEVTKEWTTKNYKYIIYKRTKEIASLYDTYERIESL